MIKLRKFEVDREVVGGASFCLQRLKSQKKMETFKGMTFDEMQLILQQVVISQREFQTEITELKSLAQSNGRAIQSMMEQTTTDRLKREEERVYHEGRMERLERISEALTNLLVSVDEDRPTILRKLNTTERNSSNILDRLPSE